MIPAYSRARGVASRLFVVSLTVVLTLTISTGSTLSAVAAASPPPPFNPEKAGSLSIVVTPRNFWNMTGRHCDMMRERLLAKWVPLARVNPATGLNTVHVSFMGDSLGYHQARDTWSEMDLCLNDLWARRPTVWLPLDQIPPYVVLANVSVAVPGQDAVQAQNVTLVISFARILYGAQVARLLAWHYSVPVVPPVAEVEQTWFPSYVMRNLPSPMILLVFHGVWDVIMADKSFGGLEHNMDHMAATCGSKEWATAVARYESFMQERYVETLRAILRKWQAKPADARRAPDYFALALTPRMNCSAQWFHPRDALTHGGGHFTVHRRGIARCSTLALGPQQVLHDLQRAAVADALAANGRTNGTVVRLLDRSEALNPCRIRDGQHMDEYEEVCRDYTLESFWAML